MSALGALVLIYDGVSSGHVPTMEGNVVEGLIALPCVTACC